MIKREIDSLMIHYAINGVLQLLHIFVGCLKLFMIHNLIQIFYVLPVCHIACCLHFNLLLLIGICFLLRVFSILLVDDIDSFRSFIPND